MNGPATSHRPAMLRTSKDTVASPESKLPLVDTMWELAVMRTYTSELVVGVSSARCALLTVQVTAWRSPTTSVRHAVASDMAAN